MKKTFLNILQSSQRNTFARVSFLFTLSSVYILRCLLLTLRMCLFAGKGREKHLLLFESLKYLTQHTIIYTKLVTVTLTQDVKFVKN